MKLVIDRSKWLRGEGSKSSFLLRFGDQKMCCLGFYLKACGLEDADILQTAAPHNLGVLNKSPDWLLKPAKSSMSYPQPSTDCGKLMEINDQSDIADDAKEKEIKAVFAKHDVEVEFI